MCLPWRFLVTLGVTSHAVGSVLASLTVEMLVHDLVAGTAQRLSAGDARWSNPSISRDGRTVAFVSERNVAVWDLRKGTTEVVSVSDAGRIGNDHSYTGSEPLSAHGRFAAFFSPASNLAPSDRNGTYDVFVRDRKLGKPSSSAESLRASIRIAD